LVNDVLLSVEIKGTKLKTQSHQKRHQEMGSHEV